VAQDAPLVAEIPLPAEVAASFHQGHGKAIADTSQPFVSGVQAEPGL